MSQSSRKYKRIEALFSEVKPIVPDSPLPAAAKAPSARPPVGDLKGRVEETRSQQSTEVTRPTVIVPPAAVSTGGGPHDLLNDIDRGPKMGFVYDKGKVTSLKETPLPQPENALCVPLVISGSTIGMLQAAGTEAGWTVQEIEIVSAVAAQLARHIKNLRLLEQNKKHAHR
jgi:hypothetical protein